jgi:hypothetical protein
VAVAGLPVRGRAPGYFLKNTCSEFLSNPEYFSAHKTHTTLSTQRVLKSTPITQILAWPGRHLDRKNQKSEENWPLLAFLGNEGNDRWPLPLP